MNTMCQNKEKSYQKLTELKIHEDSPSQSYPDSVISSHWILYFMCVFPMQQV